MTVSNSRKIELLAPAGTTAIGMAAVNCGADAVYIGAGRFGAREKAGNSVADIARMCDYAHKFWARVYVTLNTILTDAELPLALRLIKDLHAAGIDGLIIQDVGLLELDLPDIPLIASTQMHNHIPERVAFLERVGFQRAILARELSLDQIAEIRRRTTIELECFVHGALCVGYSGQCYLSYAVGGRSANRGACAQPCRRQYSLSDGRGKVLAADAYLLCLKDLNLSDHLEDLLDAGVSSFKIEGRLKDQAYVVNTVGHFRRRLDAILEGRSLDKTSSGTVRMDFAPDPSRTFNRGVTDYFISGRQRGVASLRTPKSMGARMGTVARTGKDFVIMGKGIFADFRAGDGICFFDGKGCLTGTPINRVDGDRIFPDKMEHIAVGLIIYRNHDHGFIKQLENTRTARKISIRLTFSETPDGFLLLAEDADANQARQDLSMEKIPAEKPEMAVKTIEKQLSRLGDADFICADLRIETEKVYFIPARELNELRRGVIERLAAERLQNRPKPSGKIERNASPFPETHLTYRANVLNQKAADFYRSHGVTAIEPALEAGRETGPARQDFSGKAVMISKYCILYELGMCRKSSKNKDISDPLILTDAAGGTFIVKTNCDSCEMEIYQ